MRPVFFHHAFFGAFAALLLAAPAFGQSLDRPDADPNAYPDPYAQADNFLKLPPGRVHGLERGGGAGPRRSYLGRRPLRRQ